MNEMAQLMAAPFAACLLMSVVLGYLGLHVLKREVIFIDIAMAQFAAIGAIAAHVLFGVHGDSMYALASAWCVTLVAAGFYAVVRRASAWIPLEAVIGISYAAASLAGLPLGYFLDFSAGAAVALALGAALSGAWALAAIRPKHACGEARQ